MQHCLRKSLHLLRTEQDKMFRQSFTADSSILSHMFLLFVPILSRLKEHVRPILQRAWEMEQLWAQKCHRATWEIDHFEHRTLSSVSEGHDAMRRALLPELVEKAFAVALPIFLLSRLFSERDAVRPQFFSLSKKLFFSTNHFSYVYIYIY